MLLGSTDATAGEAFRSEEIAAHSSGQKSKQSWRLVPLTLLLGFGTHAISHALAPVEPLLADLGLSPICYAMLTLTPHIGQFLTPPFWGWVFTVRMRLALVLAPACLAMGQTLVALGLLAVKYSMPWAAAVLLLFGIVLSSCCKAGLSVLQHSCLALVLPPRESSMPGTPTLPAKNYGMYDPSASSTWRDACRGCEGSGPCRRASSAPLVTGLCLSVGTTHVIGAAVVSCVPLITCSYGLCGLQFFLILPALVSALSGYALGALLPQPEPAVTPATPAPRRRDDMPAFVVLCVSCGKIVRRPHPFQTTCDKCKEAAAVARAQQTAVTALSMWRAMLIGAFLHSFSTVVVALLVSHGVPMLEAGRLMSLASILSLLLLPLLIPYAKHLTALLSVITGAVLISLLLVTISQEFGGEFAPWGGRRYVGGQESDGGAGAGDVASAMDDDHGSSAFPKPFIDDVARRARDDKHVSALALAAGTAALAPSGSAAFAHVAYSSASSTLAGNIDLLAMVLGWSTADGSRGTSPLSAAIRLAKNATYVSAGAAGTIALSASELPVNALLSWWLPRIGVVCMALCSCVAPVLPLALVPTVLPPAYVGARVGRAYGQLDMFSALGQTLGSLSLGLARQTGGFTVALRVILAGIILSVPITIYAQRAMRTAVAAMERVNAASDELMTGSRDSPISVQALTGGRVRPLARLFVVREPHAA